LFDGSFQREFGYFPDRLGPEARDGGAAVVPVGMPFGPAAGRTGAGTVSCTRASRAFVQE